MASSVDFAGPRPSIQVVFGREQLLALDGLGPNRSALIRKAVREFLDRVKNGESSSEISAEDR